MDIGNLLKQYDKIDQGYQAFNPLGGLLGAGVPANNAGGGQLEQDFDTLFGPKDQALTSLPTPPPDPASQDLQMRQRQERNWSKDTRRGIGKVLGDIADTLLMLNGDKPVFSEANKRERMSEASQEYANDPQGLVKALMAIDYGTGNKTQEDQRKWVLDQTAEQRQQGTAAANNAQTILENQNLIINRASQMLRSARNAESKPALAAMANDILKRNGIDTITVPDNYDGAFIEAMSLKPEDFVDNVEKRRANDALIGHRAAQREIDIGNMRVRAIEADRRDEDRNKPKKLDSYIGTDGYQYTKTSDGREIRSALPVRPKKGDVVRLPNGSYATIGDK